MILIFIIIIMIFSSDGSELKTPTLAKANQVIAGNIIIAFIVYGTLGLFGYLAFLDKTDGNILENYSPNNVPIQLGTPSPTMIIFLAFSIIIINNVRPTQARLPSPCRLYFTSP